MTQNNVEYIGKTLFIDDKILVIGDLHLGYEGALHNAGIMVKTDLYKQTISDLEEIFDFVRKKTGRKVETVILLGDLKHEFGRILREEWREVLDLLDYLKERANEIIIIKGNHDTIAQVITHKKDIDVKGFHIVGPYAFLHGDKDFPDIYDERIKTWIVGHGHPAVTLEQGVKAETYKCFLVGKYKSKEIIIVPSFFPFNEGTDPRAFDLGMAWDFPLRGFNVKIVSENDVGTTLDFGALGNL